MIHIIAVGKVSESYLQAGINVFLERLHNKLKVDITEVVAAKYQQFDSVEGAMQLEGERILGALGKSAGLVVALDKSGVQYSSPAFSKFIYERLNQSHITFIIGGAYGLSADVLRRADKVVSFSQMTFTHQMFRMILVEQIYRAYTIEKGIKYHN